MFFIINSSHAGAEKNHTLDSQSLRRLVGPVTNVSILQSIVLLPTIGSAQPLDLNTTKIYTAVVSALMGVLRIHHGSKMTDTTDRGKVIQALTISSGISQTSYAFFKIVGNALSIAAKVIQTAIKTNLVAASTTILAISGGFSLFFSGTLIVLLSMGIDKVRWMLDELSKENPNIDMEALKTLAPKTFKKLISGEKEFAALEEGEKGCIIKELKTSQIENGVGLALLIIGITSTVLAIIFTGGTGLLVVSVIGIVASIGFAAQGIYSMIQTLKSVEVMGNVELVIKSLIVVLGVIFTILAIVFTAGIVLQVVAGITGVLVVVVPLISIIVMKSKAAYPII